MGDRPIGYVEDLDGMRVWLGVDDGAVTIHAGVFMPGEGIRLDSARSEDFARLFNTACWEAAREDASLTGAQRAEFRAAAEEICPADCGAKVHDEHCREVPGG